MTACRHALRRSRNAVDLAPPAQAKHNAAGPTPAARHSSSLLRRARRRAGSDRGSAAPALELIIITPMILLIVLVGIATGRAATGQSKVDQAAAAAARAASTTHTVTEAATTARTIAQRDLADRGIDCTDLIVDVDASGMATPAGLPAHITVTVGCTVSYTGLGIPGWPGSRHVTAAAASPLDPHREVP